MYANCEEVLVKGTTGKLTSQNLVWLCEFYTEFDPTTLQIQSSIAARSYRCSLKKNRLIHVHCMMSYIFSRKIKASGPLYQRSCPWPRFS